MAGVTPSFRLSVWRPARHVRRMIVVNRNAAAETPPVTLDDLMEEMYEWNPGEVDPRGALDPDRTERFNALFITPFRPEQPANERVMARFRAAIEGFEREFPLSLADWASTPVAPPPELESEEEALEANALLMFRIHTRWVLATFEHVPGAVVAIQ